LVLAFPDFVVFGLAGSGLVLAARAIALTSAGAISACPGFSAIDDSSPRRAAVTLRGGNGSAFLFTGRVVTGGLKKNQVKSRLELVVR
jgi:hypothetical protein